MKKIIGTALLLSGMAAFGQTQEDSIQFKKISTEILNNGKGYNELRELTKTIGHRLSGSEAYEKSVKWAEQKLRDAGADKVWLQEVMIPVWERGKESLHIKTSNGNWKSLKMLSLGNSEGTKGKDVSGEIIMVKSMEEYNNLPAEKVKDKILFFNYPFNQSFHRNLQRIWRCGKVQNNSSFFNGKKRRKVCDYPFPFFSVR